MNNDPFFKTENIGISRKSSLGWVEENDPQSVRLHDAAAGFLGLSLKPNRIIIFFSLIFLGVSLLLAKSFYLQVIRGGYYYSLGENNRIKIEYVKAHRGIIFDRAGKPLVENVFGFSLYLIPADLPQEAAKKEQVLEIVAQLAGVSLEDISAKIQEYQKFYYEPILIKTGIGYEPALALMIQSADLPGVSLEEDFWRHYDYSEALAHLLGYVGKLSPQEYDALKDSYLLSDNIGKAGLEKQYESSLKGIDGQKKIEVDALGREKKIISQTQSVPGASLILSLDVGLQQKAYEVLKRQIPAGRGAVIISNPQTGEILALVDYPSYDDNLFAAGIKQADYQKLLNDPSKPLFTRSIFGEYPSGSTIKPTIAAGALEENIINRNTTVNSVGGIHVNQWFFPDWKAGGHGITNVTKAIALSVNSFFYYIGGGYGNFKGLGIDKLDKYFRLFGLGAPTGIDLPGERSGFVPTPQWKEEVKKEPWYIGDTYHVSIGQGDLLVTPIQVNNWTATVANGGKLMVPHLALGIVRADGSQVIFPVKIVRQGFIKPANMKIVQEGMRETVVSGSARSLSILPVAVAGKTGTAQWSSDKKNHAWFTGYAPYDNPNFCITVLVEEGGEGSSVSVPIAKEIMDYWFSKQTSTDPKVK